ncbi:hypothetical protein H6F89_27920 [Cyanobacteria bacterium FACHB-63]|nr:hypothetical protein [Cyanobacteria bacterium FACHB-63]
MADSGIHAWASDLVILPERRNLMYLELFIRACCFEFGSSLTCFFTKFSGNLLIYYASP